jgi:nucleoside-diphosphate-sugar epimerase
MRIFVAGGTGAIGRPLVSALAAAGHDITVFSRSAARVSALGIAGVAPAVGDALDADALTRAVRDASPEVVVNELTSLPQTANPLAIRRGFRQTVRLRNEASVTLVRAARSAGARRVVAQSIAFAYRPGPGVRAEADPLWTDAGGQIGQLAGSLATLESATLGDDALEGVVLRYGSFYGSGTYFAPGGLYATMVARRILPLAGAGTGIFGFVHVDDAARATVAALEGPGGVFNIVDDVPAPAAEWMPMLAQLLGAKRPRQVSRGLARAVAGPFLVYLLCDQPAVSNQRARTELGWAPAHPDWHDGLPAALQAAWRPAPGA